MSTRYVIESDDEAEHRLFLSGPAYASAIDKFLLYIRARLKYEDGLSDEARETLEKARDELHTLLGDQGIES